PAARPPIPTFPRKRGEGRVRSEGWGRVPADVGGWLRPHPRGPDSLPRARGGGGGGGRGGRRCLPPLRGGAPFRPSPPRWREGRGGGGGRGGGPGAGRGRPPPPPPPPRPSPPPRGGGGGGGGGKRVALVPSAPAARPPIPTFPPQVGEGAGGWGTPGVRAG